MRWVSQVATKKLLFFSTATRKEDLWTTLNSLKNTLTDPSSDKN